MSYTIKDNTDKVLSALEKAKKRGLEAIGLAAEGHAKRATPVDTGNLRNSITHAHDGKDAYIARMWNMPLTLSLARLKWRRDRISSPPQRSTARNTRGLWKRH